MTARMRVLAAVGIAAAAAVVAVALVAWLGGGAEGTGVREGAPPLALDLGVRDDAEARALRRADRLYDQGKRAQAAEIFSRYASPTAQVGAAFASWPNGTVAELEGLAARYPDDAVVLLNLGVARFWSGDDRGAVSAWLDAYESQPDTRAALTADWLLHPNTPGGIPIFVPSFPAPRVTGSPAEQLRQLQRAAGRPDVRARLLYGVALQRLGRQRSAERAYRTAARLAPESPEANVAVAVARFSRSEPARAFSQLGPLTKRFPKAPTVRFHIGLLLAWRGQIDAAEAQFARARRIDPGDPLGREAGRWLASLRRARQVPSARTPAPSR